jgi:hypothetical protein
MEFLPFPKLARLNREIVITEKIDGTNAQVYIKPRCSCELQAGCSECPASELALARSGDLILYAGSRTRWITPENDNQGFAKWVKANAELLFLLGPGQHFGEWWGNGIQRTYGLANGDKRFSLFNTGRWFSGHGKINYILNNGVPEGKELAPSCCHVVPVLYQGPFSHAKINETLDELGFAGSVAAPGFMRPEGIVIYHTAAKQMFKVTLEKDEQPKSKAA